MVSSISQNLGGNLCETRDQVFFMENVSGVTAAASLGQTEFFGYNNIPLYFTCSCSYGGKHFS